jgi:hypothetical protein
VLFAIAVALGACSQSDTDKVRSELKTSGDQLKKEVKSDAEMAKREAQKVKKDLNSKN